jgi:hypothetical protein
LFFLRKAAQDEAMLDAVIESDKVSDEVIGFHCQQAATKLYRLFTVWPPCAGIRSGSIVSKSRGDREIKKRQGPQRCVGH